MRVRFRPYSGFVAALSLLVGSLAALGEAHAKLFLYAIAEDDGSLVKYDPDADRIVEIRLGAGQGYINRRNEDRGSPDPSRILDVSRGRIATFHNMDQEVVLLDLVANRATKIPLGPPDTVAELVSLVYPGQASRFYVQWLRRLTPTDPTEAVLSTVDLSGRVLGTTASPIKKLTGGALPHPDGRTFYVLNQPNTLLRLEGETLAVRETHDLGPFYRSGVIGGMADVRDGRVLLSEREGTRDDVLDPLTVLTVDLVARSASPRITTGLGASRVLLVPGARTILLHEALPPHGPGAGRLHFYDVATGNKLGMVSFRADEGADLLGFHPDGRRLFIRTRNWIAPNELGTHLVIVDVATRTVIRDRPFENIGMVVDLVDEP